MAKKRRPAKRRPKEAKVVAAPRQEAAASGGPVRRDRLSRALLFTLALGVLGAVALGGLLLLRGEGSTPAGEMLAEHDPGPIHVHGLGINPADRSLFIATHTGLWRVAAGEQTAERVGESRQDTMGFTVVGANHFLGSGHPDNAEQPPLLGLIESKDAGATWKDVSLSGEADFHVLRAYGQLIYGFDASNGRLLASADRGKTWDERPIPESLFDVVAAPDDPSRLLATGREGLWASRGKDWQSLSAPTGLLAWPRADRLYLIDLSGGLAMSHDAGNQWRRLARVGGQPAAFAAVSANELYVALHDGTVKVSRDGGHTWRVRSTP